MGPTRTLKGTPVGIVPWTIPKKVHIIEAPGPSKHPDKQVQNPIHWRVQSLLLRVHRKVVWSVPITCNSPPQKKKSHGSGTKKHHLKVEDFLLLESQTASLRWMEIVISKHFQIVKNLGTIIQFFKSTVLASHTCWCFGVWGIFLRFKYLLKYFQPGTPGSLGLLKLFETWGVPFFDVPASMLVEQHGTLWNFVSDPQARIFERPKSGGPLRTWKNNPTKIRKCCKVGPLPLINGVMTP